MFSEGIEKQHRVVTGSYNAVIIILFCYNFLLNYSHIKVFIAQSYHYKFTKRLYYDEISQNVQWMRSESALWKRGNEEDNVFQGQKREYFYQVKQVWRTKCFLIASLTVSVIVSRSGTAVYVLLYQIEILYSYLSAFLCVS